MNTIVLNEAINIAFITDNNFALPTGVAIQSLYSNRNLNQQYNIYVICNQVAEENQQKLLQLSSEKFKIDLVYAQETDLHRQFLKADFPVSISATFKFTLPEFFPDLDKVLYIDCDVIIQSDLCDLYFEDIADKYAGVIKDYHALTFKGDVWKRLGVQYDAYFNSGVLLLNLNKMRQDNISQKLIDYRLNGINYYMDQDALNVIFGGVVKYLSFNYNMTLTNWRNKSSEDLANYYELQYREDKYDYLRNADIVHFASSDKPWRYYDTHYADVWFNYFVLSSFSSVGLIRDTLHSIINSPQIANIRIQADSVLSANFSSIHCKEITLRPKISVIIPIYNAENYLHECIDSILNQTFTNIEIICVDDGSTDNSGAILDDYAKQDARVKVLHQHNRYAGVARNNGIAHACGDYIAFIDSDDLFSKTALELYYTKAVQCSADVVVSNVYLFKDNIANSRVSPNWLNKDYLPGSDAFSLKEMSQFIFNFTTGGPGGKFFRRSFIQNKKLEFLPIRKSEDFYFIHFGLVCANCIAIIRSPLYYIRDVSTSLEHQKADFPLMFWEAIELLKQKLEESRVFDLVEQSFINENINRFSYNLRSMGSSESFNILLEKLRDIYKTELGITVRPRMYYYRQDNYKYLCQLLGLEIETKTEKAPKPPKISSPSAPKEVSTPKAPSNTAPVIQQITYKPRHTISEADLIRASWSYRIGRFITFIPRKIRGGIRCYQEHGLLYTLRRLKEQILGVLGR